MALLSQPVTFKGQTFSPETLEEMAVVLSGEAPVSLMGSPAATYMVMWTMRNRLNKQPWSMVRQAYRGRGEPTDTERAIVLDVLTSDEELDVTDGGLWALSAYDVARLEIQPGDLVFISKVNSHYQVHIYRTNPIRKRVIADE